MGSAWGVDHYRGSPFRQGRPLHSSQQYDSACDCFINRVSPAYHIHTANHVPVSRCMWLACVTTNNDVQCGQLRSSHAWFHHCTWFVLPCMRYLAFLTPQAMHKRHLEACNDGGTTNKLLVVRCIAVRYVDSSIFECHQLTPTVYCSADVVVWQAVHLQLLLASAKSPAYSWLIMGQRQGLTDYRILVQDGHLSAQHQPEHHDNNVILVSGLS